MKFKIKKLKHGYYIWYKTSLFTRTYIEFKLYGRIIFFHNYPYINKYDNEITAETVVGIIEKYCKLKGKLSENDYNNQIALQAAEDCVPAIKQQKQKERDEYKKTQELYDKLKVKFITPQTDARAIIELCILIAKRVRQEQRIQYVNDKLFYIGIVCQNQMELQNLIND